MEKIDRATMIKMLEERMKSLYEHGNADVQRLDKELERTPKDVELWFESGLAHNQSGLQYLDMAFEKARLEYFEANPDAEEEPEHLDVDAPEAWAMFNAAVAAFDKVIELEPEYYGVQCQRGVALGNMQRYEEAVECYRKALEEDEEDYAAAYYLACAYRDMGDEESAKRYFAMAKELNPDDEGMTGMRGAPIEG
ncbi:MAG: tetratricopeptide repeat protein [Bacteroidales bacterium]|nr:tetratricopeptide repeat protein [Bacteroidales bacterium]